MITNVKYITPDHTQVCITLDDGREVFAGVQGATWLHAELGEWLRTCSIEAFTPPEPGVPSRVSRRQARLALLDNGLLDDVELAIEGIADPMAKRRAQIDWDEAEYVARDWPLLNQMAKSAPMNMTDAQLDSLFIYAATL